MRPVLCFLALIISSQLLACSSRQLYDSAQAWQRNECLKIVDAQERGRCLAGSNTSYDDYRRQTDEAKGMK